MTQLPVFRPLFASSLLLIFFIIGCKKSEDAPPPSAPIDSTAMQVNLDHRRLGNQINDDYIGLGYEMRDITEAGYFRPDNKVLINLFNNLGPAVLRMGAESVDKTYWTGRERLTATAPDSIYTSDIDRFAAFVEQTKNWQVIFGLNLGINNPELAVSEAKYVTQRLANRLLNLELGNEPEAYRTNKIRTPQYSYNDYWKESEAYFKAIRLELPKVPFSGPGIVTETEWFKQYAIDAKPYISMLTAHHYHMGPATNPRMTIDRLLGLKSWLTSNMRVWRDVSNLHGIPYRVSESNSVYGGGREGVSNSFAAALWAADMMWVLAYQNCTGVNFHVGYKADDWYTAFIEENGGFTARPLYYGMLFFKEGSKGRVVPLQVDTRGFNASAYACISEDGTLQVSLINKGSEKGGTVQIHTGKNIRSADAQRLTASSLEATDGVRFGGSVVAADGTFATSETEPAQVTGSTVSVNLPAGSAVLLKIR